MSQLFTALIRRRQLTGLVVNLLMCVLIATTSVAQKTYYVTPTGTTPAASATTSWATSTTDLQGAISASQAGDQVWVATGTYLPVTGNDRTVSFILKDGVAIYGGFPASGTPDLRDRNLTMYPTILSGEIGDPNSTTDNSYHVIINNGNSLSGSTLLDGLVVTGGNASGSFPYNLGGGFFLSSTSIPTLINCRIEGNAGEYGGGFYMGGSSNALLINCVIRNNTATVQGGGFAMNTSNPQLVNCTLEHNTTSPPSLSANGGGAINNDNGNPVLTNCIVWNNGGNNTFVNKNSNSPIITYTLLEAAVTGYLSDPTNLTSNTSPFVSSTSVALASGSAAIDLGSISSHTAAAGPYSAIALPATDLAGNPRLAGCRVDAGAVEYQYTFPSPLRLYVSAAAISGGDGLSWATAFSDLQTAINYPCLQMTEIWVAEGIYKPTSSTANREASFTMKNGVTILGGFPATGNPAVADRNPSSYTTILSGDLKGDDRPGFVNNGENSYHVIFNPSGLTTTAVLDGVVISGGNAGENATSFINRSGGGVYNSGSGSGPGCSPVFRNCTFQGNYAVFGGAMYNSGDYNGQASPLLINCSFQANRAYNTAGAIFNSGRFNGQANPQLINCSFQGNTVELYGGYAMYSDGYVGQSSPQVTNCVFYGNGGNNAILNSGASVTARYSLFENGETDFIADPTNLTGVTGSPFAGTASVALAACSPAINAGNPASQTAATGSYSVTALPATDLAGNARIAGGRVDMGAVEYQSTPNYPVAFTLPPGSGSAVCAGGSVSVAVSVSGTGPYSYQWYKNGTAVASQTAATLSLSAAVAADADTYWVVVTGNCNSVTSTAFSLTVNALPSMTVTAIPSATLSCANTSLTLTAQSPATAFVWSSGGSTGQTLPVSQTGTYSVTATSANGCSTVSSSLSIGQDFSLPPFTVSSVTVCTGQSVNLAASGCSGQVRWTNGATTAMITLTAGSSTSLLTATCTVGSCSTTASGQVVVGGIHPPPAQVLSFTADESACPVRLAGRGIASSFAMTGPGGYVFSTVFREGSTHDALGLNVKQAGTYTLTATYTNSCGSSAPVTRTVTVGRNCP